jgi:hypothetical protein
MKSAIHIGFYVRNGTAYLPLTARTQAGFYLQIEPVEVAAIEDSLQFASALRSVIARGNPVVPTPPRNAFPKPVILRYAKVRSLKQFENGTAYWTLSKRDDGWTFGPWKRADRGWEEDQKLETQMGAEESLEAVLQSLIGAVQSRSTDN